MEKTQHVPKRQPTIHIHGLPLISVLLLATAVFRAPQWLHPPALSQLRLVCNSSCGPHDTMNLRSNSQNPGNSDHTLWPDNTRQVKVVMDSLMRRHGNHKLGWVKVIQISLTFGGPHCMVVKNPYITNGCLGESTCTSGSWPPFPENQRLGGYPRSHGSP